MNDIFQLIQSDPDAALTAIRKNTKLLALRSKPNRSNALMVAAHAGAAKVVQALIAMGVDVNYTRPDGYNAVIFAAEQGHAAILKQLIAAGAKLDGRTKKGAGSALSGALAMGQTECSVLLVRAGAPLDRKVTAELADALLRVEDPRLLTAALARGVKPPIKLYAQALEAGNLRVVLALLDAGFDKGGKKAAAFAARLNMTNARTALQSRGIEVPKSPASVPPLEILDAAGVKRELTALGLWKSVNRSFSIDFTGPALLYRHGLRLPKMRLDHTFAIDGKKGPECGAGIIVIGDLVVDGTIENGEQDFGPFLVVTKNIVAKNVAIGGAEVYVAGDLRVKGAFHGYYNHGQTIVAGTTDVGLFIADDYNVKLEGKVKGTFVNEGHMKSTQKLPKAPPLDELLAKPYIEPDGDEVGLKGHKIYAALVAGKSIRR